MKKSGDNTPLSQPTMNGCDLTPGTQTQASEQKCNDLMDIIKKLSSLFPQLSSKLFLRDSIVCFLKVNKTCVLVFGIHQALSKICWRAKILSVVLWWRQLNWVSSSFGSIILQYLYSRHLAYMFQVRIRREMPQCLVRSWEWSPQFTNL